MSLTALVSEKAVTPGPTLATVVQAGTTFSLSQIISVAAQRVIMNMRVRVQEQITRLPVRYFDDTKTGELISRIMTDPDKYAAWYEHYAAEMKKAAIEELKELGVKPEDYPEHLK